MKNGSKTVAMFSSLDGIFVIPESLKNALMNLIIKLSIQASVEYPSKDFYNVSITPASKSEVLFIQRRVKLMVVIGAFTKLVSIPFANFSV